MKLCVIGAGVLGCYHLEKLKKNPDIDLTGFYDLNESRRAEVEQKFGVAGFGDMDDLLGRSSGAIVATPASTHGRVVMKALENGCHVLVEKPLADATSVGREMVQCAKRTGKVLHVGHSEAFNPAFVRLQESCTQPQFMEIHRLAAFSPRGIDVSVVFDLMIHDLHLMERLMQWEHPLEEEIAAAGVSVVSPDIDLANVRLTFRSGCVVNCTASRISVAKMRKIRVFQKGAYFSADLDTREIVRCELKGGTGPEEFPIATGREIMDPTDALEAEHEAFVKAIAHPSEPTNGTTGTEALQVLKVAETITERLKAFKHS